MKIIRNRIAFAIGLSFGMLGFVSKLLYRPWIQENNIYDMGISEFSPSFLFTIGICLMGGSIAKSKASMRMFYLALGSMVYELEQIFTHSVFDYQDILAIVFAFLMGLIIYKLTDQLGLSNKSLDKKAV